MAFAGKGNAQLFLTEKDLTRQVASNYTKAQVTRAKGKYASKSLINSIENGDDKIDGKNAMVHNLGKVMRVWSAFTKFIKSQCTEKGKAVDTNICGTFMPYDGEKVAFMPMPAFFEAGKFRLQKGVEFLDSVMNADNQGDSVQVRYKEAYD